MFIGHFAPALAAAAISRRAPGLGTLFIGAQLVDWGFFAFAMVGIEHMRIDPGATVMVPYDLYHMPYTHSLLGAGVWAVIFGLLIFALLREIVAGILAGMVVLTHWALDWLVHRPDLTLAGGKTAYGLGLWDHPAIAIPLELGITLGAFYWYVRSTRGPIGPPLVLLAMLLLFQAINWFAPHPETVGPGLYVQALLAFAVAALVARWVGTNRWHKRARDWR
ncbi:MAG: hypothetical protein APF78_02760 [Sphingomonadales bacterium BRH_c3]|nr:MAG: hypothetical protein APF78_02760 [Sphingomonadales bacterium BRH_c3]